MHMVETTAKLGRLRN